MSSSLLLDPVEMFRMCAGICEVCCNRTAVLADCERDILAEEEDVDDACVEPGWSALRFKTISKRAFAVMAGGA